MGTAAFPAKSGFTRLCVLCCVLLLFPIAQLNACATFRRREHSPPPSFHFPSPPIISIVISHHPPVRPSPSSVGLRPGKLLAASSASASVLLLPPPSPSLFRLRPRHRNRPQVAGGKSNKTFSNVLPRGHLEK